jgi:hypothetical protein
MRTALRQLKEEVAAKKIRHEEYGAAEAQPILEVSLAKTQRPQSRTLG